MMRLLTVATLLALPTLSEPQQPESVSQLVSDVAKATQPVEVTDALVCTSALGSGGTAYTYCSATPNSFGTIAQIGWAGSLDLADGTFALTVTGCPPVPSSFGMFTYGRDPYNVPFGNGYLCVSPFAPGIYRMPMQSLGAPLISRSMATDPLDFALFEPGSSWNFQFWYRNPQAFAQGAPTTFNLSDGLHVDFAPSL